MRTRYASTKLEERLFKPPHCSFMFQKEFWSRHIIQGITYDMDVFSIYLIRVVASKVSDLNVYAVFEPSDGGSDDGQWSLFNSGEVYNIATDASSNIKLAELFVPDILYEKYPREIVDILPIEVLVSTIKFIRFGIPIKEQLPRLSLGPYDIAIGKVVFEVNGKALLRR